MQEIQTIPLYDVFGQAVFVRPCRIAEDAGKLPGVRLLDGLECIRERRADVFRGVAHVAPARALRDVEEVRLVPVPRLGTVFRFGVRVFFVVNVGEALQKEQRENILLVRAGVDARAQELGRAPEVSFEFVNRDFRQ
nr:hypothetical protein [Selenomonas sp.]